MIVAFVKEVKLIIFLMISAAKGWKVESLDVRAAFLQSHALDRDIYLQPPKEVERPGYVWKIKKL